MKKILLLTLLGFFAIDMIAQDFSKVAIMNSYPDVASIDEDDEKAAAEWVVGKGGTYIDVNTISDVSGLSEFNAVWIYLNKTITEGDPVSTFKSTYLAPFTAPAAMSAVKEYYQGGGNLFLTTHALYYLSELGRVNADPDIVGFGVGGGAGTFSLGATWGTWFSESIVIDKTGDPVYEGMDCIPSEKSNGEIFNIFPLLGEGYKEDHNCFWSMAAPAALFDNGNIAQYTGFESIWGAENLGTWDHIQDYCGAALVRFLPQGDFKGKAFALGVGAYEFEQNDQVNVFQDNIERLTANILKELSPDVVDGVGKTLKNEKYAITVSGDLLNVITEQNVSEIRIINLSGQTVLSAGNADRISLGSLPKGIYVVELADNGNNVFHQKIVK